MSKTVLFVTYGGGHAAMAIPVIRELEKVYGLKTVALAATLGGPYFRRQNMPYLGFKDFVLPEDKEAIAWGTKMAALHHQPETGIEEEEAIAYMGLSYWDLVKKHGADEAARLWAEKGRIAFFPVTVLERVIDRIKPDMVVTTNSPRAEYAAQVVANQRGIPTMSMYDLFGLYNFYRIEADYLAVISQHVIENLRKDTGLREGQKFITTGNPAFDLAFDYRGPVNKEWRRANLPAMPDDAKAVLWLDESAYFERGTGDLIERRPEDINKDLNDFAYAAQQAGAWVLIRPHPSQQRPPFDDWLSKTQFKNVLFAGGLPLYPLLNAVDAVLTYSSTVGCEALLVGRPVVQLTYYLGIHTLLLTDWGVAWAADSPEALADIFTKCFYGEYTDAMKANVQAMFPQERAAPKIAAAINAILSGKEPDGVQNC